MNVILLMSSITMIEFKRFNSFTKEQSFMRRLLGFPIKTEYVCTAENTGFAPTTPCFKPEQRIEVNAQSVGEKVIGFFATNKGINSPISIQIDPSQP